MKKLLSVLKQYSRSITAASVFAIAIGYNIFRPIPTVSQFDLILPPTVEPMIHAEKDAPTGFPEIVEHDGIVHRTQTVTVTYYQSTPAQTSGNPFITANGDHVYFGGVAANCLPFGTKLRIPEMFGDKVFTVNDRLAARKPCTVIDVWLPLDQRIGTTVTAIEILAEPTIQIAQQ